MFENSTNQSLIRTTWWFNTVCAVFIICASFLISGCNNSGGSSLDNPKIVNSRLLSESIPVIAESILPVVYDNVIYIVDTAANAVYMYKIVDGKLVVLSNTKESVPTGDFPFAITVDPSNNFAYVPNINSNSISCYRIDQLSGLLTLTGTVPVDFPTAVVVESNVQYAYATSYSNNTVTLFNINQETGVLEPVATYNTLTNPYSLSLDPKGRYLYVGHDLSGQNNIEQFKINNSGILDTNNVTTTAAGLSNSLLVNSKNGKWLYAGSLYGANGQPDNNITSFTIDTNGSLITPSSIGKNSALSQMLLMDDKFLFSADSFNGKIDSYWIESQSGQLKYFPSESRSSMYTPDKISDMALAQTENTQAIYAVSNAQKQKFIIYPFNGSGRLKRGIATMIPNMQTGYHSASAIAIASIVPREPKLVNHIINYKRRLLIQFPPDTDINSIMENGAITATKIIAESSFALYARSDINPTSIGGIDVIIVLAAVYFSGKNLMADFDIPAEEQLSNKDKIIIQTHGIKYTNGNMEPPVKRNKTAIYFPHITNPKMKTNVSIIQKQIEVRISPPLGSSLGDDFSSLIGEPSLNPTTVNCSTVSVTQKSNDPQSNEQESNIPCQSVTVDGMYKNIVKFKTPDGFEYNYDSKVTVNFHGVEMQDGTNLDLIANQYSNLDFITEQETLSVKLAVPENPDNAPLAADNGFEFVLEFEGFVDPATINNQNIKLTDSSGNNIPISKFNYTYTEDDYFSPEIVATSNLAIIESQPKQPKNPKKPKRVTFVSAMVINIAVEEETVCYISAVDIVTKLNSDNKNKYRKPRKYNVFGQKVTLKRQATLPKYVIYLAKGTNTGSSFSGYRGDFNASVNDMSGADAICNTDPNKPNNSLYYKALIVSPTRTALPQAKDWVLEKSRIYYNRNGYMFGKTNQRKTFSIFPIYTEFESEEGYYFYNESELGIRLNPIEMNNDESTPQTDTWTGMNDGWEIADPDGFKTCGNWNMLEMYGVPLMGQLGSSNTLKMLNIFTTIKSPLVPYSFAGCQSRKFIYCVSIAR